MKLFIIRCVSKLDDLLGHRFYWLCNAVATSNWWDAGNYFCPECRCDVTDGFGGHEHWR